MNAPDSIDSIEDLRAAIAVAAGLLAQAAGPGYGHALNQLGRVDGPVEADGLLALDEQLKHAARSAELCRILVRAERAS